MASTQAIYQSFERSSEVDYSIDIVKLSKAFKRDTQGTSSYTTIKSLLLSLFKKSEPKKLSYTHAVKDLTIRIPQGASVGIIGRNGSGKSSLLKLISGIYKADTGSVSVNGRVAALIELGAGFHPDFTGRENLYLGGIMHGLSKSEIASKFDEIVRFAELGHVIDDPVRTYSSGMYMRLGFSLAVHTEPDILIVDEVLAVGDAAFVSKCHDKIGELRKEGRTLFLVTHDLSAVERWCDEVVWLHEGEVLDRGEPRRVIDAYRQFLDKSEEEQIFEAENKSENKEQIEKITPSHTSRKQERWGSREVEILNVRLLGSHNDDHRVFHPDDSATIEVEYRVNEPQDDIVFGISICRNDGLIIHGSNTDIEKVDLPNLCESGTVKYQVFRLSLLEGSYSIDAAVHREDGYPYDYHKAAVNFVIRQSKGQVGVIEPDHKWEFLPSFTSNAAQER